MAQTEDWLTVMGDKSNAALDTIEVNPIPISIKQDQRVMKIRVSRSVERTNWDGIPFRSYVATVEFDCANMVAYFQQISYYAVPLWNGEPQTTTSYKTEQRRMQFRGVLPNPVERIIRAACRPMGRG